MKKLSLKIKKPNLSRAKLYADRIRRERSPKAMDYEQAVEDLPRITNETVAEHREEVLGSARKFIYPLQHSKKRIVLISGSIFAAVIVGSFVYIMLALYSFQSTSTLVYRITQVLPFPVAKAGSDYVSYESYLFELRHYMHYYETQQKVDFNAEAGKKQLETYRKQALDQVVTDAYVKQLAAKNDISVSNNEVTDAIELLKSQNRLGSNDQVLSDVLKEFWGWSIADFRRELAQQLLAQKVVQTLDTGTNARAQEALAKLRAGADFAAIAKEYSSDPTAPQNGGEYPTSLDENSRDIPPQVLKALQGLQPGQFSDVISTGSTLEIVKLISNDGGKLKAAHITFQLQQLAKYVDPLKSQAKPKYFIKD